MQWMPPMNFLFCFLFVPEEPQWLAAHVQLCIVTNTHSAYIQNKPWRLPCICICNLIIGGVKAWPPCIPGHPGTTGGGCSVPYRRFGRILGPLRVSTPALTAQNSLGLNTDQSQLFISVILFTKTWTRDINVRSPSPSRASFSEDSYLLNNTAPSPRRPDSCS